jgi:hypothetical protein
MLVRRSLRTKPHERMTQDFLSRPRLDKNAARACLMSEAEIAMPSLGRSSDKPAAQANALSRLLQPEFAGKS